MQQNFPHFPRCEFYAFLCFSGYVKLVYLRYLFSFYFHAFQMQKQAHEGHATESGDQVK